MNGSRYTEADKANYVPPNCPRCAAPGETDWIEVSEPWMPEDQREFMPGTHQCSARCADQLSYVERAEMSLLSSGWRP